MRMLASAILVLGGCVLTGLTSFAGPQLQPFGILVAIVVLLIGLVNFQLAANSDMKRAARRKPPDDLGL